jgi:hypothetical protein
VASKAPIGDASLVETPGWLETLEADEDSGTLANVRGMVEEPPRHAGVDDGVAYERQASILDRRSPMRSIFLSLRAVQHWFHSRVIY